MSVLIKGMEMPNRCLDCPLMISRDNDECIVQSEVANEIAKTWEDLKANCPLVEIPPHGRMVDADVLMTEVMDRDLDHLQRDDWKEVIQIVEDAPTIIEAEGRDT